MIWMLFSILCASFLGCYSAIRFHRLYVWQDNPNTAAPMSSDEWRSGWGWAEGDDGEFEDLDGLDDPDGLDELADLIESADADDLYIEALCWAEFGSKTITPEMRESVRKALIGSK